MEAPTFLNSILLLVISLKSFGPKLPTLAADTFHTKVNNIIICDYVSSDFIRTFNINEKSNLNLHHFKGYNGGTKFNTKFYVCNYGPGGNFNNRPIFVTGTPCSGCPHETTCKKGLCSKTGNNNDQVDEPSIPEQCMSLWDI